MSKKRSRFHGLFLNGALLVSGLAVLILLYGLVARSLSPPVSPTRSDTETELVGSIIQVEVRNGCGVAGLASKMTGFLRRHGFDVVEQGNHTTFDIEQTFVVDRVGDLASARKVAQLIGIPIERVRQDLDPDLYLDTSIILGNDYITLEPFK